MISVLLLLLSERILIIVAFQKCMVKYEIPMCYPNYNLTENKHLCRKDAVCQKVFNITYIKMEPYNTMIVKDLLHTCCGVCTKLLLVNTFNNISQITELSTNSSHFIFPVLGRHEEVRLYDYHFIPLVKVPSIYYVTAKADNVMVKLLDSCLDMWPLLIILILMVAISGFIGWVLETWVNKEEFPRTFLVGWFEGFWWSFVSVTTLGYGDKTPKTVAARLFSIVWILIGMTTFSMLTGKLTFEISEANSPLPPELAGAKIGALRHRTYDALLIATRGGILIDIKKEDDIAGIFTMVQLLRNKEIDGFILDRYTYITFSHYIDTMKYANKNQKLNINFLRANTIQTEQIYKGEKLSYGILVKNLVDYEYFADFVKDTWEVLNTCDGLNINTLSGGVSIEKDYTALFDISAGFFWPSFITSSVIIVIICLFGVGYEIIRKRYDFNEIDSDITENMA